MAKLTYILKEKSPLDATPLSGTKIQCTTVIFMYGTSSTAQKEHDTVISKTFVSLTLE